MHAVDKLDELIEDLVHVLDSVQVRRRSIETLDAFRSGACRRAALRPFLPLVRGVRERIDGRGLEILEQRMEP
jgi:hypothetical protein